MKDKKVNLDGATELLEGQADESESFEHRDDSI